MVILFIKLKQLVCFESEDENEEKMVSLFFIFVVKDLKEYLENI